MCLRRVFLWICTIAMGVELSSARGDEPPLTSKDVETLLRRLDQAESTISTLQQELHQVKRRQQEAGASPRQSAVSQERGTQPTGHSRIESPPLGFPASMPTGYEATSDTPDPNQDGIDVRKLFAEHDKRWEEQAETNNDFASSLKKVVHPGTPLSTMKVIGRVHIDHWGFPESSPGVNAFETGDSTETPNDRVGFRRLRFGVRGDVWENMEYRIAMEFANSNNAEFRDAWIGFKHLPFLRTLLIGNQKRPYGLDHLNSSRYNVFMERPFIIESFNQDSRRLGIESYGYSEDLKYNWRYGVFNQRLIQDEGNYISDHYQGEIAGRFANTCWYDECSDGRGYAHWAIAGTLAHPDGSAPADIGNIGRDVNEARFRSRPEARSTRRWINTGIIAGADWYRMVGLEGVLNVGPTQIVAEYQNLWLNRDAGFGPDLHLHGGYAYISYFLTGEHIPWNRKAGVLGRVKPFENFFVVRTCDDGIGSGWGAWQVALRYSYADLTDEDVYGGVGESLTLGLNWYWNPNARLQFNYVWGDISQRKVIDENGLLLTNGDYQIIGTRLMIDF